MKSYYVGSKSNASAVLTTIISMWNSTSFTVLDKWNACHEVFNKYIGHIFRS